MEDRIVDFLIRISYLPYFLQFVILVPILFLMSFSLFAILRGWNIRSYGSKEDYYSSNYDPITINKLFSNSFLCTFCIMWFI